MERDANVRVVVLTGAGPTFCAGADIESMRAAARASPSENLQEALRLGEMLTTLSAMTKPTVARVNGNVFGGGVGLIACCDIAIASSEARFTLSEIRLGILPAMISPFVVAAIGPRQSRRYMLSGEPISAASRNGSGWCTKRHRSPHWISGGESAVSTAQGRTGGATRRKGTDSRSIGYRAVPDRDARLVTAQRLARLRASEEGQEGLSAFLEKRAARWTRKE